VSGDRYRLGPLLVGDQPLPHSPEMEKALISCCLQDPQYTADVLTLDEEAFYLPLTRRLFRTIKEVSKTYPIFDIISIGDYLERQGQLADIGGMETIRDIYATIPTVANYPRYMEVVRDNYRLRKMIAICSNAVGDAYEHIKPSYEIIGSVGTQIMGIDEESGLKKAENIWETTEKSIQRLHGIYTRNPEAIGIPTGFANIDRYIGGLRKGEVFVLAARPSIGKTALAMNIFRNVAFSGYPCRYYSLEMMADELTLRMMYYQAQISQYELMHRTVPWEEIEARLKQAKEILDRIPLSFEDSVVYWEDIEHRMRLAVLKDGCQVLGLDYLQLVYLRESKRHQTRENEVSYISQQLKKLAKELKVPVVVLAQLNRAAEGRTPSISDLRESGAIEQDADVVGLLNRKRETDDKDTLVLMRGGHPVDAELKIGKNRGGSTGVADLQWWAHFTTYTDKPRIEDEDVPV